MHRILIALPLLGLACSAGGEAGSARDPGYVECVVPRPELCSQDHRPVCGLRNNGVRCATTPCPSWERKSYSNACVACADGAVYGWRPGACDPEGPIEPGV